MARIGLTWEMLFTTKDDETDEKSARPLVRSRPAPCIEVAARKFAGMPKREHSSTRETRLRLSGMWV